LGIGDWGLGIGPNPQSPIPNPQSPIFDFDWQSNKIFNTDLISESLILSTVNDSNNLKIIKIK
jgi:hypothetical protein